MILIIELKLKIPTIGRHYVLNNGIYWSQNNLGYYTDEVVVVRPYDYNTITYSVPFDQNGWISNEEWELDKLNNTHYYKKDIT